MKVAGVGLGRFRRVGAGNQDGFGRRQRCPHDDGCEKCDHVMTLLCRMGELSMISRILNAYMGRAIRRRNIGYMGA